MKDALVIIYRTLGAAEVGLGSSIHGLFDKRHDAAWRGMDRIRAWWSHRIGTNCKPGMIPNTNTAPLVTFSPVWPLYYKLQCGARW